MYECNNCEMAFEFPLTIREELVCPRCCSGDIICNLSIEEQIYDYLLINNVGKNKLIKNKQLRKLFNIGSDKDLRKIIQNIRKNKEFIRIVGSASGKNGGFYICETTDEIKETINNIKHRANQMLKMTHILEWKENL